MNMRHLSLAVIPLLLFLLVPTAGNAQSTLQGTVTDSVSGSTLVGVNVFLTGTSIGGATDLEGEFRIVRIPSGQYRIKISCVGYRPKEVTIRLTEAETQELNVKLIPSVVEGEEVLVTAQMRGQIAAINQQLTSNTMVNVVSEEKIQELPDANAAAAIGRLTGVSLVRSGGEASQVVLRGLSSKFSTITIDGVRISPTAANDRGVDLSTIAQGSLAGIELFKALTPDKDADAIAGSVNFVTRRAPDERLIRVDARGNYNALDESAGQYEFGGRYGERFFDNILGVQVVGNLERKIRSNETTDRNYDQSLSNYTDYMISEFLATYLNEIRKRGGASLLLDINTPDNGTIRFSNVFNKTSRDYITHNRNYPPTGEVTYEYRDRMTDITTFSSSLRGENHLFDFDIDWNLAFSESKVETPTDYDVTFTEASSTIGDSSGMRNVPAQYSKGPVEAWIPFAFNNFRAAVMNRAYDRTTGNYDKERTAFLNVARKYTLMEALSGEIKFGGKYRAKTRSYLRDEYLHLIYLSAVGGFVRMPDGSFAPKSFAGTRFDGLIGTQGVSLARFLETIPPERDIYGTYRLYPLITRDALTLWRQLNIDGYKAARETEFHDDAEYRRNTEIGADRYNLTESMLAGYLMNTLNVGSMFTVMTGVRVEADDNNYLGTYTPLPLSGFVFAQTGYIYEKEANHKETTVLPNVQAIVRPTDFMNVRLAAYKALARPDFNQRLPRFIVRSASGNTLSIGNPDLKNAIAWNYEVQTQFYGDNIGLFSVSAFYKDVTNMFHSITRMTFPYDSAYVYGEKVARNQVVDRLGVDWRPYTSSFPFQNADYELTYHYNSSKPTRLWGFEVEHQTDLRFLPWLLKNIVLNYNFTLVRSETWLTTADTLGSPGRPGRPRVISRAIVEKKQRLEDQPEFFANVSLGYDIAGFSFRLSYFYQGEYNRTFSFDQRGDGVTDAYSRWDISVKQKVTDNISLLLNANNITNTQEGTTIANRLTGWTLSDVNNRYGTTLDFGVRVEL